RRVSLDSEFFAKGEIHPPRQQYASRTFICCGPIVPEHSIVVGRKQGTEWICTENQIGEILVQGEHIADGYWSREDATRDTFQNRVFGSTGNFLRTGDLGF